MAIVRITTTPTDPNSKPLKYLDLDIYNKNKEQTEIFNKQTKILKIVSILAIISISFNIYQYIN